METDSLPHLWTHLASLQKCQYVNNRVYTPLIIKFWNFFTLNKASCTLSLIPVTIFFVINHLQLMPEKFCNYLSEEKHFIFHAHHHSQSKHLLLCSLLILELPEPMILYDGNFSMTKITLAPTFSQQFGIIFEHYLVKTLPNQLFSPQVRKWQKYFRCNCIKI